MFRLFFIIGYLIYFFQYVFVYIYIYIYIYHIYILYIYIYIGICVCVFSIQQIQASFFLLLFSIRYNSYHSWINHCLMCLLNCSYSCHPPGPGSGSRGVSAPRGGDGTTWTLDNWGGIENSTLHYTDICHMHKYICIYTFT